MKDDALVQLGREDAMMDDSSITAMQIFFVS